jgi:plastocyanin
MTWLWRICFSALWLVSATAAEVSGRVELADSHQASVRRHNYSSVVVWLEANGHSVALPPPRTFTMAQKGKQFTPHVLAIPLGSTVEFPNFDPIFHNVFSNFAGQVFDTGLYAPGSNQKVRFERPGIVRVFCNIHSSMSAVVLVLRTPYMAISTADGRFEMDDVAPGAYHLRVWHEHATAEVLDTASRRIVVGPDGAAIPLLRISESGYLEIPHKNKYGQDYAEPGDDHTVYPGVRQ